MRVFATRNFLTIIFSLLAVFMIAMTFISFGAGSNVFEKTFHESAFESDSTNLADAGAFSLTSNTTCELNIEGLTLDQSWVFLKTIIIDSDDKVVYDFQFNVSYYHGYEGGENWSEGSKTDSKVFRLPAGDYKLLVYGEDEPSKNGVATGETKTMTIKGADGKPITIKLPKTNNFGMQGYSTIDRVESVKVSINEGVILSRYFILLAILFGALAVIVGWFSSNYPVVEHVSAYEDAPYGGGSNQYHGTPMSEDQFTRNEQAAEDVFNINPDDYQGPSNQEPS